MDSELLVALAGGAIGAFLAGLGIALLRLSAVPSDADRHDRRARALDEDLEAWVADDHRELRQAIGGILNDYAARNLLYSGARLAAIAEAKTSTLQRYRDWRAATERAFADLGAEESWMHAIWRVLSRRGKLALRSFDRVEPVIDEWRTDVKRFGMGSARVYDPTRWSTDDLLRDVKERPLEPIEQEPPPGAEPEAPSNGESA